MKSRRGESLKFRNHKILIDTNEIEVYKKKYKLSPKEMAVLILLVKNTGETLSRGELLQQVWGDEFGNDMGLTQAISKLRQILGDKDKEIIRTIPKKGYRLVAEEKASRFVFRSFFSVRIAPVYRPFLLTCLLAVLLISGFFIFQPFGVRIQVRKTKVVGAEGQKLNGVVHGSKERVSVQKDMRFEIRE